MPESSSYYYRTIVPVSPALGAAPTIVVVTPNSGFTAGTDITDLAGLNSQVGCIVMIGPEQIEALNIVRVSFIKITCTIPPMWPPGVRYLYIINPDGQSSNPIPFTINASPVPVVTSVTPNHGPVGGVAITNLAGTGFQVNPIVTFNGIPATSVVRVSSIKITCVAPPGVVGAADVVVVNADTQDSGVSGVGAFAYDP